MEKYFKNFYKFLFLISLIKKKEKRKKKERLCADSSVDLGTLENQESPWYFRDHDDYDVNQSLELQTGNSLVKMDQLLWMLLTSLKQIYNITFSRVEKYWYTFWKSFGNKFTFVHGKIITWNVAIIKQCCNNKMCSSSFTFSFLSIPLNFLTRFY